MDYIGAVQGIPVCFDAKEGTTDTFALQNIHPHQMCFMENFEKQGGVSFLIIYYTGRDEIFYLPFTDVKKFWDRREAGGRKSFRYEELDREYLLHRGHGVLVPYLEGLQRDLLKRD